MPEYSTPRSSEFEPQPYEVVYAEYRGVRYRQQLDPAAEHLQDHLYTYERVRNRVGALAVESIIDRPVSSVAEAMVQSLAAGETRYLSDTTITFRTDQALFDHAVRGAVWRDYRVTEDMTPRQQAYARLEAAMAGVPVFMHDEANTTETVTDGLYFNEANHIVRYVFSAYGRSHLHYIFEPVVPNAQTHLAEGEYRIGYALDTDKTLSDIGYNQVPGTAAESFMQTKDAAILLDTLAGHGIVLSHVFKGRLYGEESRRYGHDYAHVTRLLCAIVNGERQLESLFTNEDAVERLQTMVIPADAPAGAAIALRLLRGVAHRSAESALPVAEQIPRLDGLCKDVEHYYTFSAMYEQTVAGVPLFEKRMGSHTYMLRQPTLFNGVELPAGTVMAKLSTGWAAGRVTAFSIASQPNAGIEDAERVFGAQFKEFQLEPLADVYFTQFVNQLRPQTDTR